MFKPQLTRPENGNKYYNTPSYLGINPGHPNPKTMEKGLTALPNCVSYALGRFNELAGYGIIRYLGPHAYYPYAMIGVAKRQGLEISQVPVLGGMMVWHGGPTKEGHVCIVEKINKTGDRITSIVTSDSEYYDRAFCTFKRTNETGNWDNGCYWMKNKGYIYKGCIVQPEVKKEMEKLTYEEFCKHMAKYEADQKKKPASSNYAKEALSFMKDKGYMVGDKNGNTMPQSPLTREQYAIMTYNMMKDQENK